MSLADDNGPERGGDEIFAAEYVVGVLPLDERQTASRRIDSEAAFARLVDRWEVDLSPIANAYEPVEPPASVKPAIDRRLFSGTQSGAVAPSGGLWASLAFWRGLATAAIAALADLRSGAVHQSTHRRTAVAPCRLACGRRQRRQVSGRLRCRPQRGVAVACFG